jgi:hypothetical protein
MNKRRGIYGPITADNQYIVDKKYLSNNDDYDMFPNPPNPDETRNIAFTPARPDKLNKSGCTYRRVPPDYTKQDIFTGSMTRPENQVFWTKDTDHPDRNKTYGMKSFGHKHARAWVGRKHRYENKVFRKELKESISSDGKDTPIRMKSHDTKPPKRKL